MTTLSDIEISQKIAKGELIVNADAHQIGPACYELRMGDIYYDLTQNGERIDAGKNGTILIKPGHQVVLITMERLNIPSNIIARVSSKGSLFSVGLSAVCTYADPGFKGNLGLVTQNISDKYIEIPIAEPIAKIDFSLLSSPTSKPYHGQHGFHTQIWPIKSHLQKDHDDVKFDSRVDSEEAEAFRLLPAATAKAINYLKKRQRQVDIAIIVNLLINTTTLTLAIGKPEHVATSIIINIISTVITTGFAIFFRSKDRQ